MTRRRPVAALSSTALAVISVLVLGAEPASAFGAPWDDPYCKWVQENIEACIDPYPNGPPERSDPPPPPRGHFYFNVLGDSYSSGTGTGDYYDETCFRSDLTYAAAVAEWARMSFNYASISGGPIACHGARTEHMPAQIETVYQHDDTVFLSIGGNDLGFDAGLQACI